MKNKLLLSSVATCVLISSGLNAQVTSPTNFATPPPQYVGWSGAVLSTSKPLDLKNGFNNQPINFFTNNSGTNGVANAIQRMTILGTTGFVGMGTTTPNRILQIHDGVDAQLQITNTSTGLAAGNGMLVGLFNNSNSAFIANQQNDALYFSTNGAAPGTVKMSILANGNTGIGVGFLNPLHLVDVRNGNINIGQGTGANVAASPQSYMIGGNNILWHNGEVRNLFVGVAAGANTAGALAFENTFIGSRAGFSNTTGQRNTFVGANAGESITTANFNTFIGTEAGRRLTAGIHNTFVGEQAGDNQITGTDNSIFGAHTGAGGGSGVGNRNTMLGAFAGAAITNGDDNTFVGRSAGSSCSDGALNTFTGFTSGANCNLGLRNTMNGAGSGVLTTTGSDNVFMGFQAGRFNRTGSNNTYIGTNAGTPGFGFTTAWNTATNATALGNGAIIRRSNVMVLGNNLINVGIGLSDDISAAQGPQNKLEIDAGINGFNPSPSAAPGTSGLRFRDLHSGNTTIPNPGNGVLSVNSDGDVIYVPQGGGNFGNTCGAPIAQSNLPTDWRIGMNNFSVNFAGTGNVNIGDIQNCIPGSTSSARLWVRNSFAVPNPNIGLRVDHAYLQGYAAYFASADVLMTQDAYVNGNVLVTSDKNVKTNIVSVNNSFEIINKLRPVSYNYDNTYAPQMTFDAGTHYGFIAQEVEQILPQLVKQHEVYGRIDSLGNTIDSTVNIKALNYDGLIPFAIGGLQELNAKQKEMQASLDKADLSDAQVKTNVNSFNALAKIKTLNPVQYNFTNANVPQLSFKSNLDYGFVAQQLETVYPELVDTLRIDATYDSLGVVVNPSQVLKTVNYKAMAGLLVRSIQEQQLTIDSLRNAHSKQDSVNQAVQQQLATLASLISACCSNTTATRQSNSNINQLDVELSDKDAIVLNQNVPNPFAEQTTITYNVPVSVGKAQIIFFNNLGQVIQTVDIKTRGKGKVNVFASDLSSGLYNYTLVADGKVIDSKKMVRE